MPVLSYATHRMTMRWFRGIATTPPTGLLLAALRAAPNPDGSSILEPVGDNYARQPLVLSDEVVANGWTTANNLSPIVFPTATITWAPITHLGIFSQAGELLVYGAMAAPKVITQGDALTFGTGAIQLRLK